jgi:penicillin-binding protein 1B
MRKALRLAATFSFLALPPLVAAVALGGYFLFHGIDETLVEKFGGRRWDFPSKVYSAPFVAYPGTALRDAGLFDRFAALGYRPVDYPPRARGEYRLSADERVLELVLRPFRYATHREPGRRLQADLDSEGRVVALFDAETGRELNELVLEPIQIAGLHGTLREARREMALGEVPVPLVRSVIAVEDRRFFEHSGLDLRALARAFVVNLKAGGVRQGGSTLTQQLMKNFFLTEERTYSRKLREAAMALSAERRFSKLEILENYMNEIYLGQRYGVGVHGMWEASAYYFGREPRELSLGQIATLAGMIRAPNAYSPHAHPERALERRDVVLRLLLESDEIDRRVYDAAIAEPLGAVAPAPRPAGAPYFVDYVRRELARDFPADVLTSEGYEIFTTLDPELQARAVTAVREGMAGLEQAHPHLDDGTERAETALIATHPRTGAIVAMVGGRDYRRSQFNRVIDGRRQPGSVFKPVVFLTALAGDYAPFGKFTPATRIPDEPFAWEYDGRVWRPQNYELKNYGEVTLRSALEKSLNVATARLARDVGIDEVRRLAVELGVAAEIPRFPSIALGGWETSPLEMARVYGVFANAGSSSEPVAVSKVVDRQGRVVEGHRLKSRPVVSVREAYLLTHMLEGVVARGTARAAGRLGLKRPAAGKTGTTNDFHDAWFAGYTPDLLAVVWVGFDKARPLGLTGSTAALPIWAGFMKEALRGRPAKRFRVPKGIEFATLDHGSGLRAGAGCRDTVREAFLEGTAPDGRINCEVPDAPPL